MGILVTHVKTSTYAYHNVRHEQTRRYLGMNLIFP